MAQLLISGTDSQGNTGSVTVEVVKDLIPISGDFAGTIEQGEHGHINGNVNLTGDLIVEGLLTGIDTFTLEGNGHQILMQNGGRLDLQGVERSAWVHWGDTPEWLIGDAVSATPTAAGVFVPNGMAFTWNGTWPARLTNAPDVILPDGSVAKPEVINRTRSIILQNLSRIHFHDDPGVQILRYVTVLNSGITGVLAKYPIHFHLCGESVRGSLLEGVAVLNGKNHAFVVHGSHGVTLRDCVAYNTTDEAFWYDPPLDEEHTDNNPNDLSYDRCVAYFVSPRVGNPGSRLAGFVLGAGDGNSITDSVAVAVQGGSEASGFTWPESANQNAGDNEWVFQRNVAHNNKSTGIFVWQNDSHSHQIEDYIGYRSGLSQIDHGAYQNRYHYLRCVLMGGSEAAFKLHAVNEVSGFLLLEDIVSDRTLRQMKHNLDASTFAVVRGCAFQLAYYSETGNSGTKVSKTRYEDNAKPNDPTDFDLSGIVPGSIIEIYAAGVLTHRWAGGSWQP